MLNEIYNTMMSGSVFGLFVQVVPITLIVGIIYCALRYAHIKKKGIENKLSNEIMRLLFVLYMTGLVNLIFVPEEFWPFIWSHIFIGYSHSEITLFGGEFNLVPIVVKLMSGKLTIGRWVLKMIVYNMLMFIPLGFFIPFIFNRINNKNIIKFALAVPIIIEIIQPIIGRSFDIDDILMNFAGIFIGYIVAKCVKKLTEKSKLKNKESIR